MAHGVGVYFMDFHENGKNTTVGCRYKPDISVSLEECLDAEEWKVEDNRCVKSAACTNGRVKLNILQTLQE